MNDPGVSVEFQSLGLVFQIIVGEHAHQRADFLYGMVGFGRDFTLLQPQQQVLQLADVKSAFVKKRLAWMDKEIIDEQYLSRYRLYNYLTSVENEELGDKREFINNKSRSAMDIKTNRGYIHARSAKGGILFVSSFLWEKLSEEGHRLCMYYGNKGSEFKMIDDTQQLIELVGDDNIIVQVKGKEKHETIKSIFTGTLKDRGRAYVLIRIKSNERYNALFVNIYNNDDDNDVEF